MTLFGCGLVGNAYFRLSTLKSLGLHPAPPEQGSSSAWCRAYTAYTRLRPNKVRARRGAGPGRPSCPRWASRACSGGRRRCVTAVGSLRLLAWRQVLPRAPAAGTRCRTKSRLPLPQRHTCALFARTAGRHPQLGGGSSRGSAAWKDKQVPCPLDDATEGVRRSMRRGAVRRSHPAAHASFVLPSVLPGTFFFEEESV